MQLSHTLGPDQAPNWHRLTTGADVFHLLFDELADGYCVIEFLDGPEGPCSDYIHVAANPAYAANAGIEQVVGQRLRAMVPDEADSWVARYGHVLRTGERIHFQQELVATERLLDLTSFRIGSAEDRLVAVLFTDATARRLAERARDAAQSALETRFAEALAERALLATVVDGADAFVQVCDKDLRWLAINKAAADEFESVFGVRPELGLKPTDLLADHPENAARVEALWKRAIGGESFTEVQMFGDPGRRQRAYELRFSPLLGLNGEPAGAYQFVYDVTERVEAAARLAAAEDQLRHSQKMEAVGQLTGGLAHDFNNLLGGISGALEMIAQRLAAGRGEDVARYLEAAQAAAGRAAALTHRLLAFSARQTLTPSSIEIPGLVDGLADLIRHSIGPTIALETRSDDGSWAVRVDTNQLENAILNLCLNSRDAMPDGGRILITSGKHVVSEAEAHEHDVPPGDYVELRVEDSGAGIDCATIERVFEPFFTTKPIGVGTGLGLSMVYGFARQSGGFVAISSVPGSGTTVRLVLPRVEDTGDREAEAVASPAPGMPAGGETIVVIDDEALIRMTVVDDLVDEGYTCFDASDGPSGLAVLEAHPEASLLVTDVGLPGGLNGRQVADAARVARPDLKVLFITGYAEQAALSGEDIEPGMAVLIKPFTMSQLIAEVSRLLGRAPA